MIISRDVHIHIGKKIKAIEPDLCSTPGDLCMCFEIRFIFEDNSSILLGLDWRGHECYISEYEDEGDK